MSSRSRAKGQRRLAILGAALLLALVAAAVVVVWGDASASARDRETVSTKATPVKTEPATNSTVAAEKPVSTSETAPADTAVTKAADTTQATTSTKSAGAVKTAAAAKATTVSVKAYFVKGEKLVAATRQLPHTTAVGAASLKQLLAGPTSADKAKGMTSAVPQGTKLRGLSIKSGTATVDLSKEFTAGGGSLSMYLRLGQIVYTLTQFPTVDRVQFMLEGNTLTTLGGEGLMIRQPLTRAGWAKLIG